ncbi:MAG: hypothetical protein ACNA78_09900 [Balneolaceae bacterium]
MSDFFQIENNHMLIVALKKGTRISLRFAGSIFFLILLVTWLDTGNLRDVLEWWPFILFFLTVFIPVSTAWVRVKQTRKAKDVAIAAIMTVLWPTFIILIVTLFMFGFD